MLGPETEVVPLGFAIESPYLKVPLDRLGIAHRTVEHPPVFTVEEAKALRGNLPGHHIKNLFLRNKKEEMWLVVALEDRAIDLRRLGEALGCDHSTGQPNGCGTTLNCAGGPTPWGTWLSGEEYPGGRIWECDPAGRRPAGLPSPTTPGAGVAAAPCAHASRGRPGARLQARFIFGTTNADDRVGDVADGHVTEHLTVVFAERESALLGTEGTEALGENARATRLSTPFVHLEARQRPLPDFASA